MNIFVTFQYFRNNFPVIALIIVYFLTIILYFMFNVPNDYLDKDDLIYDENG